MGLLAMGFSEAVVTRCSSRIAVGAPVFPAYELTNNNANIRRLKARLPTFKRTPTT